MFHQLVATICGITLQAQVNACRITLQQATVEYNATIDRKLNNYKKELEDTEIVKSMKNEYTASLFVVGKTVYERRIVLTYGNQNIIAKPGGIQWMYRLAF